MPKLLIAVIMVTMVLGGCRGSDAPSDWTDAACTSYNDVANTGTHWKNVTDAIDQIDSARIATELSAIDVLARDAVDRIGNLTTKWDKGDAWLDDLGTVAADYLAATRLFRDGTTTVDSSKIDQASSALSAAAKLLNSVTDRYQSLGLGCSRS